MKQATTSAIVQTLFWKLIFFSYAMRFWTVHAVFKALLMLSYIIFNNISVLVSSIFFILFSLVMYTHVSFWFRNRNILWTLGVSKKKRINTYKKFILINYFDSVIVFFWCCCYSFVWSLILMCGWPQMNLLASVALTLIFQICCRKMKCRMKQIIDNSSSYILK